MAITTHEISHRVAQNLVNLFIPVERIAQVDHAVEKHHVGPGIHSALPHHQVLFSEFTHKRAVVSDHGHATDVVIAQQGHGILQRRIWSDGQHRSGHHLPNRLLEHHGT